MHLFFENELSSLFLFACGNSIIVKNIYENLPLTGRSRSSKILYVERVGVGEAGRARPHPH